MPLAADRWSRLDPPSTIRQPRRHTFSGMDETQTLALQALRELLDNPERDDWDEVLAANRALIKAIETGEPMTRRNVRIVAEYLREAGWQEHAIGAATAQTGIHAGAN
jgi:Xaa-Pro aminopeptidase